MSFDLSNYETVDTRIKKFYEVHKNGRIITDLIAYSDQAFIVKATVFRDANDSNPASTGLAEERVGASPVNRTSALENCETSAIGRALANLNFASKARASVEEMEKVKRYETAVGDVPREEWKNTAAGAWADVGKASEKQTKFVYSILLQTFAEAGFGEQAIDYSLVGEFLNSAQPITELGDLNKKQASTIINDKLNAKNGSWLLLEFLKSKKEPVATAVDPWASPQF
jgi:hypothetical protein